MQRLIRQMFYVAWWFFRARFTGKQQPLQTVLFVGDRCNLACRHCNILRRDGSEAGEKSYAQILAELEYAYGLGSRFVDFSGGEPFIWKGAGPDANPDTGPGGESGSESGREKDINDLIRAARRIGFFSVTVTTNAQQPLADCAADSVWVSLDGVGEAHEALRGPGTFSRLLENISRSGHPDLSANMVLNALNYRSLRATVEFVAAHAALRAISLNLHTPFPGTEALTLSRQDRLAVLDEAIALKKAGYPIMNSLSGLKAMRELNFTRRCWISNFIMADGSKLATCPGQAAGLCDQCGFCMAGEMACVFAFKPDTILSGMNLRVK